MVYLCYIDESGTSEIPGNTTHYILCGVSLPIKYWKSYNKRINQLKHKYRIDNSEIHTGWILRSYREQALIPNFDTLSDEERRAKVIALREENLRNYNRAGESAKFKQAKKNYSHTEAYIHLSHEERVNLIQEIADMVGSSRYIRIFAECIDKKHIATLPHHKAIDEQALEQIVSRFEHYMAVLAKANPKENFYGLLVHDNNQTVSVKHTQLMQKFHRMGTVWTSIDHVVETPFFVDSRLNNMVQIADLCALALRRYYENNEDNLLNRIISRFDRKGNRIVGVRHFSSTDCPCKICAK